MESRIGLHEVAMYREKLNRGRHIFGNDQNGGILSHNILQAFLFRFEDSSVTGARFGLTEKQILSIRNKACDALDKWWTNTFGNVQPTPSKATNSLPSPGEIALQRYLEDVCASK
tara:strand:+ start:2430 stop:2774 length:345 start_codon:yes stop_codon:yes gene_type:complete